MTPDGGLISLLTHPSLMVRNADEAIWVFFLVECGLLRPRPRPLSPEESRSLGHGAVLVWQDDLSSSDVWSQSSFEDGRGWEQPYLRYGMYNFQQHDESSKLWKFLFTAKRNTLYNNTKYWHILAYYENWEFAAQLRSLSESPQYIECLSYMPPSYFTPDWALGRHDSPPPVRPVDTRRIISSLVNRIEYPRYTEHKMDSFKPQAPLARTKINSIIQEADVPLDPSMHAKRDKGVRLEDFARLLPDEHDALGSSKPHTVIQCIDLTVDPEIISLNEFSRRFCRHLSFADGICAQIRSLAASEALRNIIDDLVDATLLAEVDDRRTPTDQVATNALNSLVEYVSATAAATAPPNHRWDHLTLFEASIDGIQEDDGAQTFFYIPPTEHSVRSTDWHASYGLLSVIPRFTNAMSLSRDEGFDSTPHPPLQTSGGDPTSAVARGLQASDGSLVAAANSVSQRMGILTNAMLGACHARTHVFSLVYVRDERRLCFLYKDRTRSVFSNGAVLDKQNDEDFEVLVSALFGVLSHSNVQYGLHECFMQIDRVLDPRGGLQPFGDMSSLSVKVGPRIFQLGRRVDTASHKDSFETSRYLALLTDGPALSSQANSATRTEEEEGAAVLISFRWVAASTDEAHNETHLLRLGRQRRVGEVAAVYDSQLLSNYGGGDFPGVTTGYSLLASVTEPLIPLDEVRGVEQFKKAFRSIVRGAPKFCGADLENAPFAMLTFSPAHHNLYEVGILHDKITPRSLMVRVNDHEAGVLVGSGRVIDVPHSSMECPPSENKTELAWDSLFTPLVVQDIAEEGMHSDPVQYHLQLESFFYTLVWLVSKGIDAFDPIAWLQGSAQKRLLLSAVSGMEINCDCADRAVLMRSWVANLARTFDAAFKAREQWDGPPPEDLLDGEPPSAWVGYDSFMDILMQ